MSHKFHINAKGVPAPCRATQGNCPYGGDDGQQNHFDSHEEAQEHINSENEDKHGIISGINETQGISYEGSYHGNEYDISKNAADKLSVPINESNAKEVFDRSFDDGGYSLNYNADSFNNTPVELNVDIKKTGNNEYHVRGEIHENSMIESDFDSPEEYDDYMSAGPDMTYDVDFKFSGGELRDTLSEGGRYPNEGASSEDSVGAVSAGLYDLSRNNME